MAASILQEGFGWNMANGKSIKVWHDNWGFEGLSGNSICLNKMMVKENNVCELLNDNKDGWNENRVLELYGESLRD
ncbi:hypothetical protein PVK06_020449 [Gossypium arboreum]|uniref:Uncharacterized protein n=1 Tax=Gossypium arboreum TaxID=29729 RepID=A0ABR0PMD9_GOSAR|nr:hypothetical protein PVK06_020449 [Gossypium arboreum]